MAISSATAHTATATKPEQTSFKQRIFRARPEDALPLTIEHKRIFILPTRRGLAFLFSLLIMLVASVNYALSLGYALCFLLTGLFAASLLHTYRNIAGLTVENISSKSVFAGEPLNYNIKVRNPTSLERIGVMLKASDTSTVVDIKTSQATSGVISKPTLKRGTEMLGRITITSTYPLGLWRTWSYLHPSAPTIVYPAPENAAPPLPSSSLADSGENQRQSTQGDISGVRQYNPGDAISTIAWKAAARGQGLFVKTFEDDNTGGETHLSLSTTGLSDSEEQLSRLTAWVLTAEKCQAEYSFELGDLKLEASHGAKHKEATLSALATFGLSE